MTETGHGATLISMMRPAPRDVQITKELLEKYIADGLTTRQMSERFREEFGEYRAPKSFAATMSKKGLKGAHPRRKYADELPWHVKMEHQMETPARMLRTWGAIRAGKTPAQTTLEHFLSWKRRLDEAGAVVHYDPDTEEGFFYVPRQDDDDPEDLVRRPG